MIIRRRAVRAAAFCGATFAAVVGVAPSAFADGVGGGNELTANYADATFTPGSFTVRIAPGEEKLAGTTTDFIESTIDGTTCIKLYGNYGVKLTAALTATQSGSLDGISVDARGGDADVKRNQRYTGTLTLQPAKDNCTRPTGSPYVINNPTIRIDADWNKKPGAVPVEYSGADCGGNGTCYYVDATATGRISVPGYGNVGVSLGSADSGFLFKGTYPS